MSEDRERTRSRTRGSLTGSKVKVESLDALPKLRPRQRRLEVSGKDPNFVYRLVRDNPEDIAYRQELGYEAVTEDDVQTTSNGQPDNMKRIAGCYVLMKRPKELHQQHQKLLREKAMRALHGPRESFKNKAARHGFETVDETRIARGPMSVAVSEDAEG